MCKECHEYTEYKSFDELPQELKDKYKGRETKQCKDGYVDFINKLNKNGDELVSDYIDSQTKIIIKFNECGHIPSEGTTTSHYKRRTSKKGCAVCKGKQKDLLNNELDTITIPNLYCKGKEVKLFIKEARGNNIKPFKYNVGVIVNNLTVLKQIRGGIVGQIKKSSTKIYIVKCNKCGAIFYKTENNMETNDCGVCGKQPKLVYKGINDLWTTKPIVAKYLLNSEDGYKYSEGSNIKVDFVCSICGKICNRAINSVVGHNIDEYICSDCAIKKCQDNSMDLTGLTFYYWTVLCLDEIKTKESRRRYWICKCRCGEIKSILQDSLLNESSKSCGCYMIEENSKRFSGENNPSYNPNLTDEDRMKRRLVEGYNEWRSEVKRLANYTCDCCGQLGGDLRSHHLDGYNWCKERRLDLTNGVCLCEQCHNLFHRSKDNGGYGKGDNTEAQYIEFKERFLKGEFDDLLGDDLNV